MTDSPTPAKGEHVSVRLTGPKAAVDELLAALPTHWDAARERRFPADFPGHIRVYLEVTPR
ncbi:hypothetical protein [Nocardiopsis suaedae]|uniref:Uncharacterized protein n=1 Tax=Nocardiopsis suaedae TaxID=3018444 RepID=A0ABT4TJM5_9ACTN|nr:hypothetical protein [Nocardiopsis suaedae]MDA2804469.1 hypothetical protein [Nocardiopsis suaedae]